MQKFFDKKLSFILALVCLALLFMPKINLFSMEKETAGIRIDDLVLLNLSLIFGCVFYAKNKEVTPLEGWLFFILIFGSLSFLLNQFLYAEGSISVSSKIFYVVRIIEYFLFFYGGMIAARFFDLTKVIILFLCANIIVMVLQKLGVLGFFQGEYAESVSGAGRVFGLASFPAEMGALLNMMYAYLLVGQEKKTASRFQLPLWMARLWAGSRNVVLFIFFACLVALTGARIALAATLVIFLSYQLLSKKLTLPRVLSFVAVIALLILPVSVYLIWYNDALIERSEGLFSFNNLRIIGYVWDSINTDVYLYDNIQLKSGDYDMSWWIRLHKWCYAAKIYVLHPECWFQGVGPGVFSAALDGSFLRILTENGIAGVVCYSGFFYCIAKYSRALKWIMIAFLLNMIFFDIYLAYKPMSFLLLIAGYSAVLQFTTQRVFSTLKTTEA